MEVRWELKNKKTGKLHWVADVEYEPNGTPYNFMERLKALGLYSKYTITEIKPLHTIKDPLQFEIKKSTKTKKSD